MENASMETSRMTMVKWVVVILLVVGGIYLSRMWVAGTSLPGDLSNDEVKAVFLQNGQVYFGKVTSANKDFLRIETPYYLQTRTVLQEPVEEGAQPTKKQQLSLTALGGKGLQIHGPEKEMFVLWDKILYIENLREDSEVVKLIKSSSEKEEEGKQEEKVESETPASTNTNS